MSNTAHAVRIFIYWLIASVIAEVLLVFAIPTPGPPLSEAGVGEHTTSNLFFYNGAPTCVFTSVSVVYPGRFFRYTYCPGVLTRTIHLHTHP